MPIPKLKTGTDPGIPGAWLHTHNMHQGTDQEQICSQRTAERWEKFDNAMMNAYGENWEKEHPELDGEIIYEAAGRMPHGRLGIADELFTKTEKSRIKSRRVMASQPVRSAREDRLERENNHLQRENKHYWGIELVVRSLAEKGGVDFDALMQSVAPDMATSDSEVGFERGRDAVVQNETEPGMGSNTGGSHSCDKDLDMNGGEYNMYGNEGDEDYGSEGDEDYGHEDEEDYGNEWDDFYRDEW